MEQPGLRAVSRSPRIRGHAAHKPRSCLMARAYHRIVRDAGYAIVRSRSGRANRSTVRLSQKDTLRVVGTDAAVRSTDNCLTKKRVRSRLSQTDTLVLDSRLSKRSWQRWSWWRCMPRASSSAIRPVSRGSQAISARLMRAAQPYSKAKLEPASSAHGMLAARRRCTRSR